MHGIEWRWHSHEQLSEGIAWKGAAQAKARVELICSGKAEKGTAPAKRRHGEMRYAQAKMRHTMQWKSYEQRRTAEAKPRIDLHRQWRELLRNAAEPL